MIILSTLLTAAAHIARPFRQLGVSAASRSGKILKALHNRRAVVRLAHLDDHALKDIGLTRSDVHGALGVSLLDDPSRVLRDIGGSEHGQAALSAQANQGRTALLCATPKQA